MKNVQKLVLIPIERWDKIGDKIPVKEVTVKSVPQKNISHQKNHVSQIENMKVTDQQGMGKSQVHKEIQMFHFLTPRKKKEASKLFQLLTKHKIFSLTDDGEIIIKGKIVHQSNILELITHAVQNISSNPVGMKYFYKTLIKNNIPMRYISNKIGRKIMNKSLLEDTSSWRPPGHLNKEIV